MNLRIPGPTPCPPEVLQALSGPMINHRGPEFASLLKTCTERLKPAFGTKGDILILTSSGTGALEAAVVNTLSPGDEVLGVTIGYFGDRFAEIAERYGAKVTRLVVEHGQAAEPEEIRRLLREHSNIRAVTVTHNETSTGVANDIEAIAKVVHETDALLLVDSISSLSSIPVEMDGWGLDVVLSGSQKGWMVPPGLAFVAMSDRAWKANAEANMPRYYFDLLSAKKYAERGQTPATPAISLFYGLDVAFGVIEREGWPQVYARHRDIGEYTRQGMRDLGLELFADPKHASNTVTTVRLPEGVVEAELLKTLRERYGIVVAGGQGPMTGKLLRVGHLGLVHKSDITALLDALRIELKGVASIQPSVAAH
ncbi:MAG TPA: alanine--glyoxylate aminotransferase family protein [Dehalococcoidia bacterium]|nr:alanine--glyoxylate aminotransferase family protein [Dehalococcoidia bacterium]